MALIKNKKIVPSDAWQHVADNQPVPETGDVVLGLARVLAEPGLLKGQSGKVGIRLDPGDDVHQAKDFLGQVSLVTIHFPKFGDGRGYTKARLLRERFKHQGELRAVGEVLADQLFYMFRCGIDSMELAEGKDVEAALRALEDFSVTYQAATDEPRPLYRRIHRGA